MMAQVSSEGSCSFPSISNLPSPPFADVEKMTKMSKLLEILCNPTQRVQLDTLLKCEKALEKMDLFSYSGQQFGVSLPPPPPFSLTLSLIFYFCSTEIFESFAGSYQYHTAESAGQSHAVSHLSPQSGVALWHRYLCSCAGKASALGGEEAFALRPGCAVCAAGRDCSPGQQVQGEVGYDGTEQ